MLSRRKETLVLEDERQINWRWQQSPVPTLGAVLQVVSLVVEESETHDFWLKTVSTRYERDPAVTHSK